MEVPGYVIEGEIGQGGMANIYLAIQESLNRQVALKVLKSSLAGDEDLVRRFLEEARTHANLEHSQINRIYDIGQLADGRPYMAMEFLRGQTLKDLLAQRGRLSPEELFGLLSPIAEALDYLHTFGEGLVHRDVKPENIFLCERRGPILMDFGITRQVSRVTRFTESGMAIGTPHYMSPEQAQAMAVDRTTDVYALGVVMFEALAGQVPFDGDDSFGIAVKHIQAPLPALPGDVVTFQPLLEKAMAKQAGDRFQSAGELILNYQNFLSGAWVAQTITFQGMTTDPGSTTVMPAPGTVLQAAVGKKHGGLFYLFIGMGVAALLAAGLYGFGIFGSKNSIKPGGGGGSGPSITGVNAGQTGPEQIPVPEPERKHGTEDSNMPVPGTPGTPWQPGVVEQSRPLSDVEKWLEKGNKHLIADHLTTPAGENALEFYRKVLAKEPGNQKAKEGIEKIVEKYVSWAREKISVQNFSGARSNLDAAYRIEPGSGKVKEVKQQLVAAERRPGRIFRDRLRAGGKGPEMVIVPAGQFKMGDVVGRGLGREKPVHQVTIDKPFAIGRYEVTFDEYDAFCASTGHPRPDDEGWGRGGRPVVNVSWRDAVKYVEWLSAQTGKQYSLPSEAKWEYAARAGTTGDYWWDNNIGFNNANCRDCGSSGDNSRSARVGSYKPNRFKLYDTVGNVWEWCADANHTNYVGAPDDGSKWSGSSSRKITRGGGWNSDSSNSRVSTRLSMESGKRSNYIGFRVVREM